MPVMPRTAGDLEVHVAEVIFVAHDIGQAVQPPTFLDEADRDAAPICWIDAGAREARCRRDVGAMLLEPLDS